MPHGRFFWKLYSTYAIIVVATAATIGVLVNLKLKQSLVSDVEASLKRQVSYVSAYDKKFLALTPSEEIQRQVMELGSVTDARITLIAPNGTVIADSQKDPSAMENHANRPEIIEAQSSEFGIARRYSATLDDSMFYVAAQVKKEGKLLGIARVSIPLRDIETKLSSVRLTVLVGALVGILVALLVGMFVAGRITTPIRAMTKVAQALGEGKYDERVIVSTKDEIGILGDTFNRLGKEITERMTTLSHEEAQLRAMLSNMVEGVIAVDLSDRILFCNRAASIMLDVGSVDKQERKLWEFTHLLQIRELVERATRERQTVRREIEIKGGGKQLILDVMATYFTGETTRGVIVVFHDISELRRLERVRSDFVANVSHELKTPLTSIKGYVQTLLDGALYDKGYNEKFLQKIDAHADQLTNLLQDLLRLARIESEEGALSLKKVDWWELVEDIPSRFEQSAREKNLKLSTIQGNAPLAVRGDREAMERIADNLVDNALKYTPEGSVIVRVTRDNGWGCLEVEDSGVGIPEGELDRIFERFYRVDKARSRELGGTGLGLAIVKHLVRSMGGEVQVFSEIGKGSRFVVKLPCVT